jgi:hypothetical protein
MPTLCPRLLYPSKAVALVAAAKVFSPVPIAVVSSRSNIRSQIQLIDQLAGEQVSTDAADPESPKSGNGDLQHLREDASLSLSCQPSWVA